VPTRTLADAIAAEWDAQSSETRPKLTPATRAANAAIDKVAHQHAEVADMLAAYGGTDLLCYRAEQPAELIERQNAGWDPMLDWAEDVLGGRLRAVAGGMHIAQDEEGLERRRANVHGLDSFRLAAFHDLVSLSGSLILGFAAAQKARSIETLWQLSRIDETWQEEQWGYEEEEAQLVKSRHQAFLTADSFYHMC